MTTAATGGSGAAGSAGSGPIIHVTPENFSEILARQEKPIVVHSPSAFMTPNKYLTNYRGFFFFTKSKEPLNISSKVEFIAAKKMAIPWG